MADVDVLALRDLAVRAAEAAGDLVREAVGRARVDVDTKTTGTDMVTETDRASERLLVDLLLAARPDDAILGEEGAARDGTSGVQWVVDPLDGTTNFLYRFPAFGVAVGAVVDGAVVAGAVHDPVHAETFAAALGHGATCNGRPIAVTAATDLARALIGTGFSYSAENRARQAATVAHVLPRVRDIRRAGAAALDLCWVACGRLDGYYERHLQPWDLAAGGLIAAEAGAVVRTLDGGPLTLGVPAAVACAPGLADDLLALLRVAGA